MTATRALILAGALLVLGVVNASIAGKEAIKRNGEVVYLELRPVDPRSIVQGDYMALRFSIAARIRASWTAAGAAAPREGEKRLAPLALDERRVATLAAPGTPAPLSMRYRVRRGEPWLGTNGFFFEEGSDRRFVGARYGEFRLDAATGEAVLVGLRGANLEPL